MNTMHPSCFLLGAVLTVITLLLLMPTSLADICPVAEETCSEENCKLPNCACATESPPGGMAPNNVPQLVVFAFSGPLNNDSWYYLRRIFADEGKGSKERTNPNDERITMTLFVSDDETDDYCRAGEFYRDGHEVGVAGINDTYSMTTLKPRRWEEAMMGQRHNLTTLANVDEKDIGGMRAPALAAGADAQFIGMQYMANETKHGEHAWHPYDSSIVLGEDQYWKNSVPLWPYTMDFRVVDTVRPHNRHPAACYPGVWEVPVQRFYDNYSTAHDFIDDWASAETVPMLYYTIANNFWRHYSGNRAPFIINARTDWFSKDPFALEAVERFIDVLLAHELDDVYVVSMDQMLQWAKDPVPLDRVKESGLFKRPIGRKGAKCDLSKLNAVGSLDGNVMLLIEGGVLLVLLVVLIAKDRAED